MRRFVLLLICCSGMLTTVAQSNTTSGSCSPIVAKNEGTLDIHCVGLDPAVARQIKILIVQVASIRKGMATESTQQELLRLLQNVQLQIGQLQSNQPKRLSFPVEQIPSFVEAFKSAFRAPYPATIVVDVSYESRASQLGRSLLEAFARAGFNVTEHSSMHLDVVGFDTDSGLTLTFGGNATLASLFLTATNAGLIKSGVVDTNLAFSQENPMPGDRLVVHFYATAH